MTLLSGDFDDCITSDYSQTIKLIKNLIEDDRGVILHSKEGYGFNSESTIFFYKKGGELRYAVYEDMHHRTRSGTTNNHRMNMIMQTNYLESGDSNMIVDIAI